MPSGSVVVVLDGITAARGGPQGLILSIRDGQFRLGETDGFTLDDIGGFDGVTIKSWGVMFSTSPGGWLSGALGLRIGCTGEEPTLSLSGFTTATPTPSVTWTLAGGGRSSADLSSGKLTLQGFGA